MEHRAWLGIAILLLSLGAACTANGPLVRAGGSPTPPSASTTPAPRQEPSPSAVPTPVPISVTCSATPTAASEPLAITWNTDRRQHLLYGLHDPAHPAALCAINGAAVFRFISRTLLGYATSLSPNDPSNGTSVIGIMSLIDLTPHPVVFVHGMVMDFAWSPDGASVAYLLYTLAPGLGSGDANQLWLKTGKAPPRALTPLIPVFGRGGSISDQISVRFSHDGKYLLMVDTFVDAPPPASPDQAHFQVREMPSGNLVWVPPSALSAGDQGRFSLVTMATWSGTADRLFYRDAFGVHSWEPPATVAMVSVFLAWFSPSVSPDDRFVAYTGSLDVRPSVEVRDLVLNEVRSLPGIRAAQFFLSSSTLLEGVYEPSNQQGLGTLPYAQTGSVAFDLKTGVETLLPVAISPIDYWPR